MSKFDLQESRRLKEAGKALAADAKKELLFAARDIARGLAEKYGSVHADMVAREMDRQGLPYEELGPAAGSLFKTKEWTTSGAMVQSARTSNHARRIFVWKLTTTRRKPSMKALDIEEVMLCAECDGLGKEHVPASGSPIADLMIIGQSPGVNEVKQGMPFVGDSGTLLEGMLAEIPLGREDVYITNVLKCHPPGNRPGLAQEKKNCFDEWLRGEVKEVAPSVILLLGKDAWSMFKTKREKHGLVLRMKRTSIIYWYHPAYYLRRGNVQGFLRVAELVKRELER